MKLFCHCVLMFKHFQAIQLIAWQIKPAAHDAPGALLLEFAFGPTLRRRGGAGGRYFNERREHVPQCSRALNWTTGSFEGTDFMLHLCTSSHLHDRAFSLWPRKSFSVTVLPLHVSFPSVASILQVYLGHGAWDAANLTFQDRPMIFASDDFPSMSSLTTGGTR